VITRAPSRLREFVKLRTDVEAVLQQVSAEVWDLVLIAVDGTWVREEFASTEDAEAVCRDLDVRLHPDWDDPRMARRMNRRDHWNTPGGQKRAL
jgi:hypothetical protein